VCPDGVGRVSGRFVPACVFVLHRREIPAKPAGVKTILFLPTQGPHLPRSGPAEKFDWREQCRLAARLRKEMPGATVYVPSAFQQAGAPSELAFYGAQLRAEGVPEEALVLDPRGLDTVEQCELALALAHGVNARLVAVSCAVHVARVRWLLRGHQVQHVIARGTPSRWLQFTHVVLAIAFPFLDVLGLRGWWKRRVSRRRLAGRQ